MNSGGYTVEVTNLSVRATEKDLHDFFSFSGAIEHIEIIRSGDYASTAFVTFREPYALETAVLLSGATIVDQPVCIARWGQYEEAHYFWSTPWRIDDETVLRDEQPWSFSAGEALTMAQDVVKAMLAKGYVLSKDALIKARAFDESNQVSATAAAKVVDLSKRIGLTDRINAGINAVKSADERFRVLETTTSVASATGKTAARAANAVVSSSYFSAGALLVSDALTKAAKLAADLAAHGRRN